MRGDFHLSSANVTLNEPLNVVSFNANLNEILTWRGLLSFFGTKPQKYTIFTGLHKTSRYTVFWATLIDFGQKSVYLKALLYPTFYKMKNIYHFLSNKETWIPHWDILKHQISFDIIRIKVGFWVDEKHEYIHFGIKLQKAGSGWIYLKHTTRDWTEFLTCA